MDDGLVDGEDRAYQEQLDAEIEAALATLSDQEAEVVRLYFGLYDKPPMSLDELAAELAVTPEQARRWKNSGLDRLRRGPDGHAGSAALLRPRPTAPRAGQEHRSHRSNS